MPAPTGAISDGAAAIAYPREFSKAIPGTKKHKRIRDRIRGVIVRYQASVGEKKTHFVALRNQFRSSAVISPKPKRAWLKTTFSGATKFIFVAIFCSKVFFVAGFCGKIRCGYELLAIKPRRPTPREHHDAGEAFHGAGIGGIWALSADTVLRMVRDEPAYLRFTSAPVYRLASFFGKGSGRRASR